MLAVALAKNYLLSVHHYKNIQNHMLKGGACMQIYSGLLGFQEHYNDLLLDSGDSKLCGVFILQSSKLLYEAQEREWLKEKKEK